MVRARSGSWGTALLTGESRLGAGAGELAQRELDHGQQRLWRVGAKRADPRHDPFHRPCTAIAARLGAEFAEFPGGHLAPMELPAPFAAGLRDVFGRL